MHIDSKYFKAVFIAIFILFSISLVWVGVACGKELYRFVTYTSPVLARVAHAEIVSLGADVYQIVIQYDYRVEGQVYRGQGVIGPFRNELAAKLAMRETVVVHVQPDQPSVSWVNRKFPYRSVLNACTLLVAFLYIVGVSRTWQRQRASGSRGDTARNAPALPQHQTE